MMGILPINGKIYPSSVVPKWKKKSMFNPSPSIRNTFIISSGIGGRISVLIILAMNARMQAKIKMYMPGRWVGEKIADIPQQSFVNDKSSRSRKIMGLINTAQICIKFQSILLV